MILINLMFVKNVGFFNMTKEEFIKALAPLGFELIADAPHIHFLNNISLRIYFKRMRKHLYGIIESDFDYTQESLDKVIELYHSKNNMTREQFVDFVDTAYIGNRCIEYYPDYCQYDMAYEIKYTLTNAHKLLAIKQVADKLNNLIENTQFEEVE